MQMHAKEDSVTHDRLTSKYECLRKNEQVILRYMSCREVPKSEVSFGCHGDGESDLIGHLIFV